MLDFRSRTASTPYYRQRVDYGRLVMMVVSSALLLSIILTFGRPRNSATSAAGGATTLAVETSPESRTTLIGVAVLVGSMCVVACVMLVLYRMVRPGRVQFAIHDVVGPPPDFSSLVDQPLPPTPQEAMANIAAAAETPPVNDELKIEV